MAAGTGATGSPTTGTEPWPIDDPAAGATESPSVRMTSSVRSTMLGWPLCLTSPRSASALSMTCERGSSAG